MTSFVENDYKKIAEFYGVKSVGKYTITVNDEIDGIKYVGATFDFFDPNSNQIISNTLGEGLIVDKVGVFLDAIFKGTTLYILLFSLISIIFNVFVFWTYFKKKRPTLNSIINMFLGNLAGVIFASITSFSLLLVIDTFSPNSDNFYGSLQSTAWIISTPLVLGCLAPLISLLIAGLIFKKRIVGEKSLIIVFLQGAFVGSISPLLFHYYLLNETQSSLNVFLIFSSFSLIVSIFSGIKYYNYEVNSTAVRFLVLCILYTSPIVLINLYLLKNQDSITSLQIVYISLLFVPVFLIEKSWIPISNLFKFNDVDTSPVPGKIGRFSEILNSTIASEKDRVKVEFKSNG